MVLNNRTDLYELKNTNAVAFYEEHVFHDNLEDATWFHTHMNEIAESAAKGLCEYFGIPYVAPAATPSTPTMTTAILRKGSTGPEVKSLQKKLLQIGYYLGSYGADGDYGSGTEAAVRAFQKDHGLTIDGIVGTATQEAIKKAIQELETPKFNTLRKGNDGAEVKAMQLKLLKAGYYIGPYGADSDYGENTELAVRLLQKDSNLTVDGVFGKQTSEALDLAVSNAAAANKAIVNKIKLIKTPPKCTKDLAIKYAKQELGNLEKDSLKDLNSKISNAGDNNYTKYAQEADAIGLYNALVQGQPWCATWVDNVFIHAYGLNKGCAMKYMPTTKSKSAACNEAAAYYQKANKWFNTPEIGDQVFFKSAKYNYAHTGLVIDIKDNKVITIEGNTSSKAGVVENGGAVEQKEYPLNYSNFKGFGRPDYDEEIQEQEPIEDKSYMVRITAVALNVRSGPGTNYPVVKVLREGGKSFTIVDE
ncbi:MAG: peptidoglycan-binding protein [Lactobacillus johnsonii]|nr:peptidoglycan-binding protein [Lactobacillus johnsonii]MDY6196381.1 peptidoglycan-binding protein [Lactobacillus johnsonii]